MNFRPQVADGCHNNAANCHADAACTADTTTGVAACACNTGFLSVAGQTVGTQCGKSNIALKFSRFYQIFKKIVDVVF